MDLISQDIDWIKDNNMFSSWAKPEIRIKFEAAQAV